MQDDIKLSGWYWDDSYSSDGKILGDYRRTHPDDPRAIFWSVDGGEEWDTYRSREQAEDVLREVLAFHTRRQALEES